MDTDALKDLCNICGVSGEEEPVADYIVELLRERNIESRRDACGNVVCEFSGEDHSKKILIAAHMDEVGFMVSDIGADGVAYVFPVGGTCPDGYYRIFTKSGASGVLHKTGTGFYPADMGFKSREEAEKHVTVGDAMTFEPNYREQGDAVFSKALDNRVSVFALIEAISSVEKFKYDTVVAFTVREEISGKGAIYAAKRFDPDCLIIVDTTVAKSVLDKSENTNVEIGGGVYIKVADACTHVDSEIVSKLCDLCEAHAIRYGREVCLLGTTELFYIERDLADTPYAAISMPTRDIHTDFSSVSIGDLKCLIDCLCAVFTDGI